MGTVRAVPYVSLVEVCTRRGVWQARTASSMCNVPITFVSTKDRGAL